MAPSVVFAFLHHLAAFTLFAAVAMQFLLIRGEIDLLAARRLLGIDRTYGFAAVAVLVIGALRVMYFEKGATYYLHSAPFIAKMILFALVGLISTYPTLTFLSWRKSLAQGLAPQLDAVKQRRLARWIHIELTLLALILLCAALMAKGVGMFATGTSA